MLKKTGTGVNNCEYESETLELQSMATWGLMANKAFAAERKKPRPLKSSVDEVKI